MKISNKLLSVVLGITNFVGWCDNNILFVDTKNIGTVKEININELKKKIESV